MTQRKRRQRGVMVWRCPTCSRHVPREHDQCACGTMKAWGSAVVGDRAPRGGSTVFQLAVVAAILGAAMLAMLTLLR